MTFDHGSKFKIKTNKKKYCCPVLHQLKTPYHKTWSEEKERWVRAAKHSMVKHRTPHPPVVRLPWSCEVALSKVAVVMGCGASLVDMMVGILCEVNLWGCGAVNNCFGVWPNSMIWVSRLRRSVSSLMLDILGRRNRKINCRLKCLINFVHKGLKSYISFAYKWEVIAGVV